MLTQHQIELIRSTFSRAVHDEDGFANRFYENLFQIAPEARPLFPRDLTQQRSKISHMLAFVVRRLHVPSELVKPIENLGIRHVAYGTLPEHYPIVGQAILTTFEQILGEDWTPDAREAWAMAYQFMADTMIAAADTANVTPRSAVI